MTRTELKYWIVAGAVLVAGAAWYGSTHPAPDVVPAPQVQRAAPAPAPMPAPDARHQAAARVLANARQLAAFEEDNGALVVRFKPGVLPDMTRAQLHQLVSAIADADAVLQGTARGIYCYGPDGRQVAKASPFTGVSVSYE